MGIVDVVRYIINVERDFYARNILEIKSNPVLPEVSILSDSTGEIDIEGEMKNRAKWVVSETITPLEYAFRLLATKFNTRQTRHCNNGWTMMQNETLYDNLTKIIVILINEGADVNVPFKSAPFKGWYPLDIAEQQQEQQREEGSVVAHEHWTSIVELLRAKGAKKFYNTSPVDRLGNWALDYLAKAGYDGGGGSLSFKNQLKHNKRKYNNRKLTNRKLTNRKYNKRKYNKRKLTNRKLTNRKYKKRTHRNKNKINLKSQ